MVCQANQKCLNNGVGDMTGDAQEILREKIYREHGLNIPNKLWNISEISPGTDFMKVLDLDVHSRSQKQN